jgi:uncharacterized membrane protein
MDEGLVQAKAPHGVSPRGTATRKVASAAVFTAFVAAATMAFTLAIPANPNGYFNLGEVMVYICALLTGPYVGAFAGGLGSAIADVALGFAYYAPGTFVIKGTEGFVVGYLSSKGARVMSERAWKFATALIGAALGSVLAFLGASYYAGSYQLSLGFPIGPVLNVGFDAPPILWIGIGALVFIAIAAGGFLVTAKVGWMVLSVLAGGVFMYTGYFLYNLFVIQVGYAASAGEFPFDIGQALIGLVIAVPVVLRVRRIQSRTPFGADRA